jgi:hypothetical protein
VLENYLFRASDGDMLLGLGAASLFNHSSAPSLDFRVDRHNVIIRFYAARDIQVCPLLAAVVPESMLQPAGG